MRRHISYSIKELPMNQIGVQYTIITKYGDKAITSGPLTLGTYNSMLNAEKAIKDHREEYAR